MEHSETTTTGPLARLSGAFGGIIFGIILSIGAMLILIWNEGRSVKRHRDLNEGSKSAIAVSSAEVLAENEGKLVHTSGAVQVNEKLTDNQFGVETEQALKLIRSVEMYQWKEKVSSSTKKKLGGGTETTKNYSYETAWSSSPVDSSRFKIQENHQNPANWAIQAETFSVDTASLGAFQLAPFQITSLSKSEDLPVDSLDGVSSEIRSNAKLNNGGIFLGNNPDSPQVGDYRIQFEKVPTGAASLVAKQKGNSFERYQAGNGTVALIQSGNASLEEMFATAKKGNSMLAWILRGGGFLGILIGLSLFLKPLTVLGDMIPFLGRFLNAGLGLLSAIFAAILSFLIIAIAWIAYRPLLGILLLAACAVMAFFLFRLISAKKQQAVAAS